MTLDLAMPLAAEIALFAVAVLVLFVGLITQGNAHQRIGWLTLVGLVGVFGLTFLAEEGRTLFSLSFVQDSLALFSKRLFIAATIISLLGSLTLRHTTFIRRSAEYHFAVLSSLIGMMVLASARDLVLVFVAFELMSIPLYVLTGFLKRDSTTSEAALKFFLVGTVSSAVIAYGMSFIYGVTGSTALEALAPALADGNPMMVLGMTLKDQDA